MDSSKIPIFGQFRRRIGLCDTRYPIEIDPFPDPASPQPRPQFEVFSGVHAHFATALAGKIHVLSARRITASEITAQNLQGQAIAAAYFGS